MSLEALVLAISAIIRPTSMAAVIAILATRRPQRLLTAYVVAGLAFSLGVGIVVVFVLQGFGSAGSSATVHPLIDEVLGAAALCYAGTVAIGWLPRPRAESAQASMTWMQRRVRDLSPSGAAAVGVLTHIPGLVYLAALNAIVRESTGKLDSVVQVVVYNSIWFSMPIVALLLSVHRPAEVAARLAQLTSWTRRHRRVITVVFCGGLGIYLLVAGGWR